MSPRLGALPDGVLTYQNASGTKKYLLSRETDPPRSITNPAALSAWWQPRT